MARRVMSVIEFDALSFIIPNQYQRATIGTQLAHTFLRVIRSDRFLEEFVGIRREHTINWRMREDITSSFYRPQRREAEATLRELLRSRHENF